MNNYKNFKILFLILSVMGVLFSGYMSSVKFFSTTCAFGETCPYFLGFPACYVGFILFLALFVSSLIFLFGKVRMKLIGCMFFIPSLIGVIFAGYYAIGELPLLFKQGLSSYMLGLPTCVLGALFFIIIFIASIFLKKKIKADPIYG